MKREKNTIKLSNLSLKEKVGQLVICKSKGFDQRYTEKLRVGGIFLAKQKFSKNGLSKKHCKELVDFYEADSKIKLFKAGDVEGYWNPFERFQEFKSLGDVKNPKEAYKLGKDQGKVMKEVGLNLNFSPIVEIRNNVWPGRSFTGSKEEIASKIRNYIKGLHSEGIMATAKHYPGGNLVKDPHWFKFEVKTTKDEQEMFNIAIDSGVEAIMTGHPKTYGAVDSEGKQVTVSKKAIGKLREKFNGLIITDAVTMLGLRISYLFNFRNVYADTIKAGNDIILDTAFDSSYNKIRKRMNRLLKAVIKSEISEERVNRSVKRVLEAKGYKVTT